MGDARFRCRARREAAEGADERAAASGERTIGHGAVSQGAEAREDAQASADAQREGGPSHLVALSRVLLSPTERIRAAQI